MAIMRVLPTAEQIQMPARWRQNCPWDIFLPETIQVTGDETFASPRKLSRKIEEEASQVSCGLKRSFPTKRRWPTE
jgi:hypothetical protein